MTAQTERRMTARYRGSCCICGDTIDIGDLITWSLQHGARHDDCEHFDAEAAAEARHFESYASWQDHLNDSSYELAA